MDQATQLDEIKNSLAMDYLSILKKNEMEAKKAQLKAELDKECQENLEKLQSENIKIIVYALTVKQIWFGKRCESFDVTNTIYTNKKRACEKAFELVKKWVQDNKAEKLESLTFNDNGKYIFEDDEDNPDHSYGPAFETAVTKKVMDFNHEALCSSNTGW